MIGFLAALAGLLLTTYAVVREISYEFDPEARVTEIAKFHTRVHEEVDRLL